MSKHEDILTLAVTRYKAAIESDQTERAAYDDDIRFAINDDGCQWPAAIRASREGDNPPRPCLVSNKIPEKIDNDFENILQSARNSRQLPRTHKSHYNNENINNYKHSGCRFV